MPLACLITAMSSALILGSPPIPPPTATEPWPPDGGVERLLDAIADGVAKRPATRVAITTDRSIYRPGDTIWFQVWRPDKADLGWPSGAHIASVSLQNARGTARHTERVQIVDGRGPGQLLLRRRWAPGAYRLVVDGDLDGSRLVFVERTEPPRFPKQLAFVRTAYRPGATAVAILSVERSDGRPAADAPVEVEATFDGVALPKTQTTTDGAGRATLRVRIPEAVERGGVLSARVVVDGQPEAIMREVPVTTGAAQVQFFPEGGALVGGLSSRVYVEATLPSGRPADVTGRIVDQAGAEVARFESGLRGMGRFELTPIADATYRAIVEDPPGLPPIELPAVAAKGCVMRTVDDFPGTAPAVELSLACRPARAAIVVGSISGAIDARADINATERPTPVRLELGERAGVARLTALATTGLPLAERLVMRHPGRQLQIELKPRAHTVGPRGAITVNITTRDPEGRPVPATVALSAVDEALVAHADDEHPRLGPRLLMTAELPGRVDEPMRYFDPGDPQAGRARDLLMGTRGYRRFAWIGATIGDHDGDGWPDMVDRCPRQAEDLDGEADDDGCPEPTDRDRDGVDDAHDLCPGEVGPPEHAGCADPPPDVDRDGIPTAKDQCPGHPEDVDLFEDEDGCPDADNDQDGIPDVDDHCPNEPELYDGVADEDGCPEARSVLIQRDDGRAAPMPAGPPPPATPVDRGAQAPLPAAPATPSPAPSAEGRREPTRVVVSAKHIEVRSRIYFKGASARIDPASYPVLAEVAAVMLDHPHLSRVEIGGHSDSSGPAATNKRISQRRAEAVRAWLVEAGVEPERLVAVGYGEEMPIALNRTRRGRAANRRVEFRLLERERRRTYQRVRRFPLPGRDTPTSPPGSDQRVTLFWSPAITTDSAGRARVEFPASDRLGGVRLMADGLGGGHPGFGDARLHVERPLAIAARLPADVVVGDRLRIDIPISRYGGQSVTKVALRAKAEGALRLVKRPRAVRVGPDETSISHLDVEVISPGSGALSVTARAGAETHHVRLMTQAHRPEFPRRIRESGVLRAGAPATLELTDGGAERGSVGARLRLLHHPIDRAVDGLERMLRTPNGCFEQTTSANYPNVQILRLLETLGDPDPRLLNRAQKMLRAGYARLVTFEVPGGGFEWFGERPAHAGLTAYGLLQFLEMRAVYPVSSALIARTRSWLMGRRDGEGDYSPDQRRMGARSKRVRAQRAARQAYITYALATAGARGLDLELRRAAEAAEADAYRLALASLAYLRSGLPAQAAPLIERLRSLQRGDGGFPPPAATLIAGSAHDGQIQATALAAITLIEAKAPEGEIIKAGRWLMGAVSGHTQSTVLRLEALRFAGPLMARDAVQGVVVVQPERGPATRLPLDRIGAVLELSDAQARRPLRLTLEGRGEVPFMIEGAYRTRTPRTMADPKVTIRQTLEPKTLPLGGAATLRVEVARRPETQPGMALLRLGVPAGLEIDTRALEELRRAGRFDHFERQRGELVLYLTRLDEPRTLELPLIARTAGTSTGVASRVGQYYAPRTTDTFAAPLTVEVEPR